MSNNNNKAPLPASSLPATIVDMTGTDYTCSSESSSEEDPASASSGSYEDDAARKRNRRGKLKVSEDDDEDDNDEVVFVGESKKQAVYDDQDDDDDMKKPAATVAATAVFFDCPVCLETHLQRFRGYQLGSCGHLFCRECLNGYIQSQLKDKNVTLVCPENKCAAKIQFLDVRACTLEVGDGASWGSYQELSTEAYLDSAVAAGEKQQQQNNSGGSASAAVATVATATTSTLRRCPTNHCNYIFSFEQPQLHHHPAHQAQRGQHFACPACQQNYCLNCPVVQGRVGPAHDDHKTCAEVLEEVRQSQERQRQLEAWKRDNAQADARFQELLQREQAAGKTQPCPKCQTPITKNGGCNHMHCTRCHTSFNWK